MTDCLCSAFLLKIFTLIVFILSNIAFYCWTLSSFTVAGKIISLKIVASPGFSTFTYRVGAGEVVASHHLHVGLFYKGDPELVPVAGVGAQQLSVTIHRQVIVYNHLHRGQRLGSKPHLGLSAVWGMLYKWCRENIFEFCNYFQKSVCISIL